MKFYDTSSILKLQEKDLFSSPFVISSITLEELEKIKNSQNHSLEIQIKARNIARILSQRLNDFQVLVFKEEMLIPIKEKGISINNDMKILAGAINLKSSSKIIFVTNDLCQMIIAKLFFNNDEIETIEENLSDNYKGYLDLKLSNEDLERFYSNPTNNIFNALINQYIIIRNNDDKIIDRQVWTVEGYRPVSFETFDSKHFGRIKPLDVQQQIAADSFTHNKITMIKGPAGSGKTILSLSFLFNQLEKGRIDKIIIFCNTIAAKNAAKLGLDG